MVDKGTNEWDGDEGVECDDYEPDYDAINDRKNQKKKKNKMNMYVVEEIANETNRDGSDRIVVNNNASIL